MSMLEPLANNYGYYPRTMMRLSAIAYDGLSDIPREVEQLGWKVVWGPAELVDFLDVSYSLAYICQRSIGSGLNEYTVVIRGTNMMSLESWIREDFAIGSTRPFNELAPHAPANALVSHGTFRGTVDLLKLRDPVTKLGIVTFLQSARPSFLYVTGHSLGGTLTPPLFAYLNDILYGGGHVHNMALWSFAGLTPGDVGFNTYFNGLGNPEFPFRLHNTLDVAPFCWWSFNDIKNIYRPYGLDWGFLESEFFQDLFDKARGKGYAQPQGDEVLVGDFNTDIVDECLWAAQGLYQHHTSTYQTLVDKAYPEVIATAAIAT